jgi:mitochondrial fission protein ELM1
MNKKKTPAQLIPDDEAAGSIAAQPVTILFDGRTGNLAQSLGLANALGWKTPEVHDLQPRWTRLWRHFFPVRWQYGNWPNLTAGVVIGTGWDGSRLLRRLKRENPALFTVQLMRPTGKPADYDVVSFPRHDVGGIWQEGSNVVVTAGATNRVTPALLATEADRWSGRLKGCIAPRLAVMLGGSTKRSRFTAADLTALMRSCLEWARVNHGSLLVTTSRRTGPELTALTRRLLEAAPEVPHYFWAPGEPARRDNPYFAFLATAEAVVVTGDSVSMISEAATAGKPVYVGGFSQGLKGTKFTNRFFTLMQKLGYAAPWKGKLTLRKMRHPLNDTAQVAAFVQAVWARKNHSR